MRLFERKIEFEHVKSCVNNPDYINDIEDNRLYFSKKMSTFTLIVICRKISNTYIIITSYKT